MISSRSYAHWKIWYNLGGKKHHVGAIYMMILCNQCGLPCGVTCCCNATIYGIFFNKNKISSMHAEEYGLTLGGKKGSCW